MEKPLRDHPGRTVCVCTELGVDSYFGVVPKVEPDYIELKERCSKEVICVALKEIEACKEVVDRS